MKNYYIYFKEPFCVKAKNEDEALERFSDAIYRNIDRYFYTDTKSQTEKDEHNLANFFVSEWGDDTGCLRQNTGFFEGIDRQR